MSMSAERFGGRRIHRELEDCRNANQHPERQSPRVAATIKSLKRLIVKAERIQGKILCLIGE